MRKDIIFCTLICLLSFGFVNGQVDIKRQGYYQVIVSDTVYSQHSQEYQAVETLLNLQLKGVDANVIAPRLTVTAEALGIATDTIRIVEEIPVYITDTIVQIDTVFIDNEQSKIVNSIEYEGQTVPVEDIFFTPETVTDTIYATECFEDYNQTV